MIPKAVSGTHARMAVGNDATDMSRGNDATEQRMECFRQGSSRRNRANQKAMTSPTTAQNLCAKETTGSYTTDKTRQDKTHNPSQERGRITWRSNSRVVPSNCYIESAGRYDADCRCLRQKRSESETNKRTSVRSRQLRAGWLLSTFISVESRLSSSKRDVVEMTGSSVTWRLPHRLRYCGAIVEPSW